MRKKLVEILISINLVMEQLHEYKIVTLGDGRVGKTSLTLRFARGQFNDSEKATINANFFEKQVQIGREMVKLSIWDTAGQERYRAIASNYYRNAQGAIIVYDITEKSTFDRVETWVNELQSQGGKDIAIILVGNKCDKENEREIPRQNAIDFAKSIGVTHFSTSAKTGSGVNECFMEITRALLEKDRGKIQKDSPLKGRKRITVVENNQRQPSKKSKCC
ncbi:unnamed protein product [Blepharisma stoltei]|uniref:Uncharacterized protein n=1 Tax=Blepharisma stoltei TaxID=1481888 RepID=A0AAU9JZN7_9CILI|nr:unnamed protein product [Blepharisma stoltei]